MGQMKRLYTDLQIAQHDIQQIISRLEDKWDIEIQTINADGSIEFEYNQES